MKRIYVFFLLLLASGAINFVGAQTRYLDPIFTSVTKNADVTYGVNATVLYFQVLGQAIPEALKMDIYRPTGDTETERPVILMFHTGNFLPFVNPANPSQLGFNGACGGTKTDSFIVEAAHRLARMGYVVASVDYRLGWNPLAPTDVDRRYGLINAAYRGVQDARTAIRFFKKSYAEAGNPWGVDTSRITIWGQGTGGYITLNTLTIDNYLEIPTASGGKFIWDHDQNAATPPIPMVIEPINGNIFGTSVGINPTNGDTLAYPNHVGYSSEFQLAVNMAGAVGDSTWVDGNEAPLISFHVPTDNFAPYNIGIVNVPGTPLQVVEVVGSYWVQHKLEAFGVNDAFANAPVPLALEAEQLQAFAESPAGLQDPTPGLYPFNIPGNPPTTTSPWEWTSYVPAMGTCNNSKAVAAPYVDTIIQFFAPRACFALGLQECIDVLTSTKEPLAAGIHINATPNPSFTDVLLRTELEHPMLGIELFNIDGQLVRSINGINQSIYTLSRAGLPNGTYVAKVRFADGVKAVRLLLN